MKKSTKNTFIIRNLSFFILFKLLFLKKNRDADYYYDLHTKTHGIFITVLTKVFGFDTIAYYIERIGLLAGLTSKQIPHGDLVNDYHLLHIKSNEAAVKYLDNYYQAGNSHGSPLSKLKLSSQQIDSLYLKEIGEKLWLLIENIKVLQQLGCKNITLLVIKGEYPENIIKSICTDYNINYKNPRFLCRFSFSSVPIFSVFLIKLIFSLLFRFIKYKQPRNKSSEKKIAVEYVDPQCKQKKVTHVNYLINESNKNNFIIYVRHRRKKIFNKERFELDHMPIVYIDQLKPHFSDIISALQTQALTLKQLFFSQTSLYYALRTLEKVQLYIDLSAFFSSYNLGAHLYNTFPNGRHISVRHDSGIVTGLCRRHNIVSATYQSRTHYLRHFGYYFDVFDIYFSWGKAWVEDFQYTHFIEKFVIVGNVYHGHEFLLKQPVASPDTHSKHVLLFTTDIELTHYPQHYTQDYTKEYLVSVLNAAKNLARQDHSRQFKFYLKPKLAEHESLIQTWAEVTDILSDQQLSFHVITDNNAIPAIDHVICLGFTTPGVTFLSMHIPTVYYTQYTYHYNDIFNAESSIVVHNSEEIGKFLNKDSMPCDTNDFDPYCDGKANVRIIKYLTNAMLKLN